MGTWGTELNGKSGAGTEGKRSRQWIVFTSAKDYRATRVTITGFENTPL